MSDSETRRKAAFHAHVEHHMGQIAASLGGKPQMALVISYDGHPEQDMLFSLDDSRLPESVEALKRRMPQA